jgi:hypothetical protein
LTGHAGEPTLTVPALRKEKAMRFVTSAFAAVVLSAFVAGSALACMGHPKGHVQTDKPQTEQSTVASDKK